VLFRLSGDKHGDAILFIVECIRRSERSSHPMELLMKTSLQVAIASVFSLAICGHPTIASAQLLASSSFDSFSQHIVDLNPDDGIAAGVCLTDESVGGQVLFRNDNGELRDSKWAYGADSAVAMLIDTADAYLASRATPTSASSQVRIDNGFADVFTDGFINFILAPFTEVTFSIAASAHATPVDLPGSYAFATAAANGWTIDKEGTIFLDTDGLSSYLASSAVLSVTLRSAADPLAGTLELATAAHALTPAVPEPASMPMLGAGLALMGGLARWRAARKMPLAPAG
jgi:hypothetical protein